MASADLLVIGNPNIKLKALTQKELSAIYLNQPVKLSTRENLTPIGQPDNSSEYQQFYQKIMGWNLDQANNYWSSKLFSGQAAQPETANTPAEAIQFVQNTPGAIAYVDSSALNNIGNSVKILYGNYIPPKPKRAAVSNNSPSMAQLYDNEPKRSSKITGYHSMYDTPVTEEEAKAELSENTIAQQVGETSSDISASSMVNNAILGELQQVRNTVPNSQNIWQIIADQINLGSEANLPRVQAQIKWFTSHPHMLNSMIRDATPYIYYVYQETQRRHMPVQFTLLPMIESGYYPYAYSNVGAGGIWQMMPETATDYGMPINWWYDSRRDIITSTNAALNFLVSLHVQEKNWDLAAAAYNVGPGALDHAIKKNLRAGRPIDYWSLPLPKETQDYVPRLLAIAEIIKNPAKYGIKMPYVPDTPYFTAFTLQSQIDVADAAKLAGVPQSVIERLNTGMRRFATDVVGKYTLLIPAFAAQTFQKNLASMVGKPEDSWKYYQIKAGETLADIAKMYNTTVALLQSVNKLKTSEAHSGSGILVPIPMNRFYQNALNVIQPSSQAATIPQSAEFAPMPKVDTWAVEKITTSDILTGNNMLSLVKSEPKLPEKTHIILVQPQATSTAIVQNESNNPISDKDDLKTMLGKIYRK